jgi:PAS domain S-box-containing protein
MSRQSLPPAQQRQQPQFLVTDTRIYGREQTSLQAVHLTLIVPQLVKPLTELPAALSRKQDETTTALHESENVLTARPESLLDAIVESSDDAIVSKNLDGIIMSWNPAASRIFGYEPQEIIGQSILRLIPEHLHKEEDLILSKLRAGERIEHFETTRIRKDGSLAQVALTISPVRGSSGTVIGASKIARDISGKKQIEELQARLAAIVESSDDAIVSKDLNGIIQSWNAAARRMFGYAPEEIIGESILRLIPEELHSEETFILAKLRSCERIDHYETVRLRKNGERFEVSVTISPLIDRQGNVIGASKVAREISERKRIERQLMQSEKLAVTGRMAATIAHEINNPLASVLNLIYLARISKSLNSARSYMKTAEAELERVSHIARQTLGYYRENGVPVAVLLEELIEEVVSVYQGKLSASGITVDCRFDDHPPIIASKGELIQVLSNLIANSIDAMPEGGLLHLGVKRSHQPAGVEVTIRDHGTGISQEHLERVFEPFFTTKGNLGTGIGLWVAKQIVERHGGQIKLSSSTEPETAGTAIVIFLPLTAPPDVASR